MAKRPIENILYEVFGIVETPGETAPSRSMFASELKVDPRVTDLIAARAFAIAQSIARTAMECEKEIDDGIGEIARWMQQKEVVRVIGAGRALLSAAIPANRLAHAGALVTIWDNVNPLPNTRRGGAILAASASGKTEAVLSMMKKARESNQNIRILGVADYSAGEFGSLCDVFIGIRIDEGRYFNPLSALADTGEYVISELLDAMVVAAGKKIGVTDEDWRGNHENLGPTGPYAPR